MSWQHAFWGRHSEQPRPAAAAAAAMRVAHLGSSVGLRLLDPENERNRL